MCRRPRRWITDQDSPWNQGLVREAPARGDFDGHWLIQIDQPGEYEVRLRRWPEETGAGIRASLPAAADVPGELAFRAREGRPLEIVAARLDVGDRSQSKPVEASDSSADFHVRLKAGVVKLSAAFATADGATIGAYYVSMERL